MMRRTILVVVLALLAVGCGSKEGENYDAKQIAVDQPGQAPPPMNSPGGSDQKRP
jgi:uncharacterized protein YcfL